MYSLTWPRRVYIIYHKTDNQKARAVCSHLGPPPLCFCIPYHIFHLSLCHSAAAPAFFYLFVCVPEFKSHISRLINSTLYPSSVARYFGGESLLILFRDECVWKAEKDVARRDCRPPRSSTINEERQQKCSRGSVSKETTVTENSIVRVQMKYFKFYSPEQGKIQ